MKVNFDEKKPISNLVKIYIFAILCCLSSMVFGDIDKDMLLESVANAQPDNLYITHAEDIDKMTTVTYYLTQSEPKKGLLVAFNEYAKSIGETNGAVIIDMNNKSVIQSKDKKYLEYLRKLKNPECRPPDRMDYLPTIIFDNRKSGECSFFRKLDNAELDATILKLFEEHAGLKGLKNFEKKSKLQHIAEDAIENIPVLKGYKSTILNFIEFLVK